jgi:hypothetical protein
MNMAKLSMEKLKKDKLVGYALLIVGLIIIFLAIIWAYGVFTSGSSRLSIFRWDNQNIKITSSDNEPPQYLNIPGDQISNTVNIALWLALMFFLVWAGAQVANLGVKIIRSIKVEIKE